MTAALHRAIKVSRERDTELHRLMNTRKGDWGLLNGQLVRFGRRVKTENGYIVDGTKIDRFVRHTSRRLQ